MKRCLMIILIVQMFLTSNILFACTVFYASDGEMVLAGNNEDGSNPNTKEYELNNLPIWYSSVVPLG